MAEEKTAEDFETLPLDEIRRLAEQEARQQVAAQIPRDEQGRFVKTEPTPETEPEPEQTAPEPEPDEEQIVVVRREIDLGDGAGVQVFEGTGKTKDEAFEDYADKLAEAQKNATRKIRDMSFRLKEYEQAVKPKPKELTPDEEYVYKQEFEKNPVQGINKIFKDLAGMSIEEIRALKERNDRQAEQEAQQQAASVFIATHDDYVDNTRNTKLLLMHIKSEGLKVTSENLHKAYVSLKDGGLLELKQATQNSGQEQTAPAQERIAQPTRTEVTTQRTRKESGLSTTRRPAAPVNTEPSEDDMYSLSMDEIRKRANAQLSGRR